MQQSTHVRLFSTACFVICVPAPPSTSHSSTSHPSTSHTATSHAPASIAHPSTSHPSTSQLTHLHAPHTPSTSRPSTSHPCTSHTPPPHAGPLHFPTLLARACVVIRGPARALILDSSLGVLLERLSRPARTATPAQSASSRWAPMARLTLLHAVTYSVETASGGGGQGTEGRGTEAGVGDLARIAQIVGPGGGSLWI